MPNDKTAVVWISDGSGVPFSDLEVLEASHPGLLGQPVPYKGTFEERVPVGTVSLTTDAAEDVFVPEAEWCVGFPEGAGPYIEDPDRFGPDTPILLQGMIEGKWVNRLIGTDAWGPASLGNNLVAGGPGIPTTLAAIEQATAAGSVVIRYRSGSGDTRTQSSLLGDLRDQGIGELVRAVLLRCQRTNRSVDWINCSAQGVRAAVVNEPERMQHALQASGMAAAELATPGGVGRLAVTFVPALVSEGLAVPPATPVTIEVRDAHQQIQGEGQLLLRPDRAPTAP